MQIILIGATRLRPYRVEYPVRILPEMINDKGAQDTPRRRQPIHFPSPPFDSRTV